MKKRIGRIAAGGILASIVMIAFGIVLIAWPEHTLELAAKIVGIALLAVGLVLVLTWLLSHSKVNGNAMTLAEGLVGVAAGALVLLATKTVVSIVPITVGAIIVLNGLVNLKQANDLRKISLTRWQWPLLVALLTIVVGVLVVLNPLKPVEWAVMGIGGALVFNGVTNLWIAYRYHKYH